VPKSWVDWKVLVVVETDWEPNVVMLQRLAAEASPLCMDGQVEHAKGAAMSCRVCAQLRKASAHELGGLEGCGGSGGGEFEHPMWLML
jgi:hypothetical protein